MATLNTSCGWVAGDPSRVLIAMGLPIGQYQVNEITVCMNQLCDIDSTTVDKVRTLLTDWDTAQASLKSSNITSDGRTLIKADVLEWEANKDGSSGPEAEISRISGILYQYFSFCPVCANGGPSGATALIRS